jgi:hypothetical protein
MRRRKALRAAASKARDPRRVDQSSAAKISAEAIPDILSIQAVYSGTTCLGFLYSRGRQGIEAFDSDTRSLGIYHDRKNAADAVTRAAGRAP